MHTGENKPKISIIIPVYNVADYLTECIESIVVQEYTDYEIILVDDGSTDGSERLCDELAQKYDKIQVIHKENGGLVSARKAGILKSSGEYIFNVDSDDYIDVNLLKNISDKIDVYKPDVIAFDFMRVDESGHYIDKIENQADEGLYSDEKLTDIRSRLIYDKTNRNLNAGSIIFSIWSKIFKKSCVLKHQLDVPNKIDRGEDMAVVMPTLCTCSTLYVYRYTGYCYRQRSTSIVHTFDKDELKESSTLISHLIKNAPGIDIKNIELYMYYIIVNYLYKVIELSASYSGLKETISYINNEPVLQLPKKVEYQYLPAKEKIQLFCVKHRLWKLLWTVYKIMRMKNKGRNKLK